MTVKLIKLKHPKRTGPQKVFDRALDEVKGKKKEVLCVGYFVRYKNETVYEIEFNGNGHNGDALIATQTMAYATLKSRHEDM